MTSFKDIFKSRYCYQNRIEKMIDLYNDINKGETRKEFKENLITKYKDYIYIDKRNRISIKNDMFYDLIYNDYFKDKENKNKNDIDLKIIKDDLKTIQTIQILEIVLTLFIIIISYY